MKRSTILILAIPSLLVPVFLRLATNPRSEGPQVPAESEHNVKTARVAKAPEVRSDRADLPTTVQTNTEPDRKATGKSSSEQNLQSVFDAELPALCDSLVRDPDRAATDLRQRLVHRWAETDGPAAAAWAAELRQEPTYRETLTRVALGWARSDLTAALDWARTLPDADGQEVTLALAYETARTDPARALEIGNSLEPDSNRDDLLEVAISQWRTTDFAAAVQWAEQNASDPDLRQRLLAAVAVGMAGRDASTAATLAVTALKPGNEQDRVAVAIVQRWAQNDPKSAASWVAQFPDTAVGETAARNLVAFWAAQDREAAASWLRTLPEGTLRNAGMTAYAQVQPPATGFMKP